MNEIYWLTRLDDVKVLIGFIIAFAVIGLVFGISIMMYNIDRDYANEKREFKLGKQIAIIASIIAFVFAIGTCFIPSTKDAYMIYGIGGTIDYVKSNETAKQLPDKCLQALDKYLTDEIK